MHDASRLRIAVMPAADPSGTAAALARVHRRHPHVEVDVVQTWGSLGDLRALRDGPLDAAVLVGPLAPTEVPGVRLQQFGATRRHLVVAADHPLARRPRVELQHALDLATFPRPDHATATWRRFWLHVDERGADPRYVGRAGSEYEGLLAIASGRVAGIAPGGWGRVPGVATRLLAGLPPVPLLLATRTGASRAPLRVFVDAMLEWERPRLTDAESTVADLVSLGLTDREIADVLHLSPRTVETQVASARRRLGLRSRAHLAAYAVAS